MADRPFTLDLEFTNPYKRTALFVQNGRAFFGLWRPPEVVLDGDEDVAPIRLGQEGQLDLLAEEYYGDRRLWYIIAQANKIDFPLEEVRPGDRIVIPKPEQVRAALLASGGRASEVA